MLRRAEDIIGLEALYEDHLEMVEAAGGAPQLAAAHVVGIEAREAAGATLALEVASILVKGMEENLVTQVLGRSVALPSAGRNGAITNILMAFVSGLQKPTSPAEEHALLLE